MTSAEQRVLSVLLLRVRMASTAGAPTAAALALVGLGGCAAAAAIAVLRQQSESESELEPQPAAEPEPEPEPELAFDGEKWLDDVGVHWVDGRAPRDGQQKDVVDLAVDLANFSMEVEREANGQGGCVDRKPHKQRMSGDFGGPAHDGVRYCSCCCCCCCCSLPGTHRWCDGLADAVALSCGRGRTHDSAGGTPRPC